MKAKLIGEKSAGMTAVEIYDTDDNLVWSHMYFKDGCTENSYTDGLCQAWDDMRLCDDVDVYEGGDLDDDGNPVQYDSGETTGIILEYDSSADAWARGEQWDNSMGQSSEILAACILTRLVGADEFDDEFLNMDSSVAEAITKYIR